MKTWLIKPKAAVVLITLTLTAFFVALNLFSRDKSGTDLLKQKLAANVIELGSEGLQEKLRNGEKIDEIEYRLAEMVRFKFIKSPIGGEAYNLKDDTKTDFSRGQSAYIAETLHNKKQGYFIDIGAGDGETESVSLYFERQLDWKGLLIEPNPNKMAALLTKHRKADTLCACVNTERNAAKRKFLGKRLLDEGVKVMDSTIIDRMCFPFLTIVTALSRRQVDLLIINVNGRESAILNTIPYNLIDIEIISVELNKSNVAANLTTLMESKGYGAIKLMDNKNIDKKDIIFRKNRKR